MSTTIFAEFNSNSWLGIPRTAVDVLPVTAGLLVGQVPVEDVGLSGTSYPKSRLRLSNYLLHNRSGGVITCGLVGMYPDKSWVAGSWTHATTTFADDTTDAQDVGAGDFAIFTTTDNDGFVVGCRYPFNVISVDQSTASNGAPTVDYAYWGVPLNGSATTSDWRTITNGVAPSYSAAAAERLIVTTQPLSLMRLTATGSTFTGAPLGYYFIRVRGTTAPVTTGGTAARLYVGTILHEFMEAVADNATFDPNEGSISTRPLPGGIVAIQSFWSVAADGNFACVEVE